MTTLLKALTSASGLSRRKGFAAIREGRAAVAGVVCNDPSGPYEGGELTLDGEALGFGSSTHAYLMLNKPPGFISTAKDELGRTTVLDLVPEELRAPGLHAVGRLDRDTSGLLLLTTDGDLTYVLTHPKHEVEKEYWLRTLEPATEAQIATIRRGVELDGELRRPLRLRRLVGEEPFELSMTLREGRNRQVHRMIEAAGGRVTALRRVSEGPLVLSGLAEGQTRRLTEEELADLAGD